MVITLHASVLGSIVLTFVVLFARAFRKSYSRQKPNKFMALETARCIAPCTPKNYHRAVNGEPLLFPVIKIEKHRSRLGIDIGLKYELPLDTQWEFPRQQLQLGKSLRALTPSVPKLKAFSNKEASPRSLSKCLKASRLFFACRFNRSPVVLRISF